jgi:hypothetical protein
MVNPYAMSPERKSYEERRLLTLIFDNITTAKCMPVHCHEFLRTPPKLPFGAVPMWIR